MRGIRLICRRDRLLTNIHGIDDYNDDTATKHAFCRRTDYSLHENYLSIQDVSHKSNTNLNGRGFVQRTMKHDNYETITTNSNNKIYIYITIKHTQKTETVFTFKSSKILFGLFFSYQVKLKSLLIKGNGKLKELILNIGICFSYGTHLNIKLMEC